MMRACKVLVLTNGARSSAPARRGVAEQRHGGNASTKFLRGWREERAVCAPVENRMHTFAPVLHGRATTTAAINNRRSTSLDGLDDGAVRFTFFGITILRERILPVDTLARLSMPALHTMGKSRVLPRSFQNCSSESTGTAHGWVGTLPCPYMFPSTRFAYTYARARSCLPLRSCTRIDAYN